VSNLQTLCGSCNSIKGKNLIDFRGAATPLTEPLARLPQPKMPFGPNIRNATRWEQYLRRVVNQFYRCAATESVVVRFDGDGRYDWIIALRPGINSMWLRHHLSDLAERIREAMELDGARGPDVIEIAGGKVVEDGYDTTAATSPIDTVATDVISVIPTPTAEAVDRGQSIMAMDQNERMAIVRSALASGQPSDREQAIRDIANALHCKRIGPSVRRAIENALLTAQLRNVVLNDNGQYYLFTRSVSEYTVDQLVSTLSSAIGSGWVTRYDAIVAGARHLGYRRTGKDIQAAFKSAINAAIRRGLLERDGAEYIKKVR
jgi:hypothetical protein